MCQWVCFQSISCTAFCCAQFHAVCQWEHPIVVFWMGQGIWRAFHILFLWLPVSSGSTLRGALHKSSCRSLEVAFWRRGRSIRSVSCCLTHRARPLACSIWRGKCCSAWQWLSGSQIWKFQGQNLAFLVCKTYALTVSNALSPSLHWHTLWNVQKVTNHFWELGGCWFASFEALNLIFAKSVLFWYLLPLN